MQTTTTCGENTPSNKLKTKNKRRGEIQRLGIAGFVTETGDCCLDLADEISK